VNLHTTASWPTREDRRAALVWLAIFWIFVGVGFGFDLHNYLHEQPPAPGIVHVHAIATTLWLLTATALVLMFEMGNVTYPCIMANTYALIAQAYSAFNRRDIDGALALMSENVDWPAASERGRIVGKEAIRAYWTRQWAKFDPHVEPVEVIDIASTGKEADRTEVKIHQVVKNLDGGVLSDQTLLHVFAIANGLIERMDIGESRAAFG